MIVYPYLIYCVKVGGNACEIYLKLTINKQKKYVRVFTSSYHLEPTEPIFKDFKIILLKN